MDKLIASVRGNALGQSLVLMLFGLVFLFMALAATYGLIRLMARLFKSE